MCAWAVHRLLGPARQAGGNLRYSCTSLCPKQKGDWMHHEEMCVICLSGRTPKAPAAIVVLASKR